MSEFPSLAEVLAQHADYVSDFARHCTCGEWSDLAPNANASRLSFAKHQADAWRSACTIRTVEKFLDLPAGSVFRGPLGGVFEKYADGHWYPTGGGRPLPLSRLARVSERDPALLIWHPAWGRP